ncbi:unnamed protein product [Brassica rapa]|uniref:Uncharacterized protein n=1 Tax=Brassica campestris TaxID=3711 RepID=A0A8D9MBY3_BRACM|nr:unnamed protein product [Brassica rapa]
MVASGLVSRGGGVEGGTWGELLERAGGVRVDAEECTRGLVDLCTLLGVEVGCPCGLWILCTPAEEVVGCPCGYNSVKILFCSSTKVMEGLSDTILNICCLSMEKFQLPSSAVFHSPAIIIQWSAMVVTCEQQNIL